MILLVIQCDAWWTGIAQILIFNGYLSLHLSPHF